MTAPKIKVRGTDFVLDDYDRTSQVKKIKGNNQQWGQRFSFKKNSGIIVTKSKNNMVVDVSHGVVEIMKSIFGLGTAETTNYGPMTKQL